jgi:hypothetical protein
MHLSGSPIVRRTLIVDGLFCVVVGLAVLLLSGWLADQLPVSETWLVVAAGAVTVVWGVLLVVASRAFPNRAAVTFVASVNVVFVVATVAWLVLEGPEMTAFGIAVVGALGVAVLRFAIYQVTLLRQ